MKDNEYLYDIICKVSSKYCQPIKGASFENFKDFKVAWNRTGIEKTYKVSDYVSDAPTEILYDFLDSVIARSTGSKNGYSSEYIDWVTSDDFVLAKRPTYLQRSRNVSRTTVGKDREIGESLDRLMDANMICPEDIHNSYYTWTDRPSYTKIGSCNPVFRVITISSSLDSENVPEKVLDYVTYHETLHMRRGYRPHRRAHDKEFRSLERSFPEWKECEKFLTKMKTKHR